MSAWARVQELIASSPRRVDVLPPERGEQTLRSLEISADSTLGAVALETGGILVDGGFMRLLGGGSEQLPSVAEWAGLGSGSEQLPSVAELAGLGDAPLVEPVDRGLCVAFDAVGGFFVLLAQTSRVHSFLPDTLDWQDTGLGYSQFVHWALHGDLDDFYGDLRRLDWHGLPPDRALSIHEAAGTTRPMTELWALYPGGKLRELLEAR